MTIRDRIGRRTISFARRYVRNSWIHRLPITSRVYKLIFHLVERPSHVEFRGVTLRIDQADWTITPTLLTGEYEMAEFDLLESILELGMVVIDVGANNGAYSCISSREVGEHGKVVAIEPIAENLALLRESVALNEPGTANVTIVPTAAGDKTGTLRIYLDDGNSGTHSVGVVASAGKT